MREPTQKQQTTVFEKQQLALFGIYFAYFALASVGILVAVQAVGESVVNPFCEDNKATCAKHYDDTDPDGNDDDAKLSLEANFKQGEFFSVMYGLISTVFGMLVMFPLSCCYSKIIRTPDDNGSSTGLLSGSESACLSLFKKCKTALPHGKRDAILLSAATITFSVVELGFSVFFSALSKNLICSTSDNSTIPCDDTYANLTKTEGDLLLDLSNEAGSKMTATGVSLSLVGTLLIPLLAGALVLVSKMRAGASCCNDRGAGSEEMGSGPYATL